MSVVLRVISGGNFEVGTEARMGPRGSADVEKKGTAEGFKDILSSDTTGTGPNSDAIDEMESP